MFYENEDLDAKQRKCLDVYFFRPKHRQLDKDKITLAKTPNLGSEIVLSHRFLKHLEIHKTIRNNDVELLFRVL